MNEKDAQKTGWRSAARRCGLMYVIGYTIAFALIATVVYSVFLINGKGFVWHPDGAEQHYIALEYIGRWFRSVFRNIFIDRSFNIPLWDFSIGQGGDILTTLQYYGLGDPLVVLAAFVSAEHMEFLYNALIIARMYLSGLFFSGFCFYMKCGKEETLLGALAYAFCGYALKNGVCHPFFLTPMLYFPFLVWGGEKILHRENPALFIISLFLTTLSNFYFAYMQCVMLVVYVVVRYFSVPEIKHGWELPRYLIRFVLAGLIGVSMAAVVLLPVANCFLNNIRVGAENGISLLYPKVFYEEVLNGLISMRPISFHTVLGLLPLCFLSIVLLFFMKKEHRWLKCLLVIMLIMLCFPVFGHVLNGFSYICNRWTWAISFIEAYVLVLMWPELNRIDTAKKRKLCFVSVGYLVIVAFLPQTMEKGTIIQWIILILSLLLICLSDRAIVFRKKSVRKVGLGAMCILSIAIMGLDLYVNGNVKVSAFMDQGNEWNTLELATSKLAEPYMEDDMFTRHTLHNGVTNESVLSRTFSTATYWSLQGNRIAEYRREMEIPDKYACWWSDYDQRAYLDVLNNVGYRVYAGQIDESTNAGYGFDRCMSLSGFTLYENRYPMPIGYTYDSVLTQEEYGWLTTEQKQEALLQNVLLHDKTQREYNVDTYDTWSWETEYSMEVTSGNCEIGANTIIVKEAPVIVRLSFDSQADCEMYLNVKNLQVELMSQMDIIGRYDDAREAYESLPDEERERIRRNERLNRRATETKISVYDGICYKQFNHYQPDNQYYSNAHDYLINMGYQEGERSFYMVTLNSTGIYTYDDLRVVCQVMDDLPTYVSERSEESIKQIEFGVNSMKGNIEVSDNKILCMAVPYSTGWKAYVDGKETPVLRANIWSMAIELEPGVHEVKFKYMTPWLETGVYISLLGWVCFAAIEYGFRKKMWYVK